MKDRVIDTLSSEHDPLLGSDHIKTDSDTEGAKFFGIETKAGYTKRNILAIPMTLIIVGVVASFVNT